MCARSVAEAVATSDINRLVEQARKEYHWPSGVEAIGGSSLSQDCTVSKAAYEYGLFLQPHLSPNKELFDALELGTKCGLPEPEAKTLPPPSIPIPVSIPVFYVDPNSGSDTNAGTTNRRDITDSLDVRLHPFVVPVFQEPKYRH